MRSMPCVSEGQTVGVESTPTVFSRSRYHRPQISIEPVQDLLDNDFRGGHVSAIEEHMALVLRWCPQKPKHRLLSSFEWKNEIMPAVEHEDRHRDSRCKIKRVDLRGKPPGLQASGQ